jgi:FKBP-type peptidyl-prolyl cis-trans isomerase (trigger factor)
METQDIRDAEIITKPEPFTTPEKRSPRIKYAIAFVLGVGIAFGGYTLYDRLYGDVALIVNGTRISNEELAESIDLMSKSAALQGIDVKSPEIAETIRKQALENIIGNTILMRAAETAGTEANPDAVKLAYDGLVTETGGAEELAKRMEAIGLTDAQLRENIENRLRVDALLEQETDIETVTVSDEEITAYIESISQGGMELPPLEEIKPQVEAQLRTEKQQVIVDGFIKKLRDEAKITYVDAHE